jgi:hypothetical protein
MSIRMRTAMNNTKVACINTLVAYLGFQTTQKRPLYPVNYDENANKSGPKDL